MADGSLPRKPRKSNFSTDEVDVLVDSVRSHYGVLYGKFAKRATNRWIRQKAWMDILKKVNGVSIEKRTLQEVKNKWKKCQYVLKEKGGHGIFPEDQEDSWEDVVRHLDQSEVSLPDSMPLQERLSKVAAQEKIAAAGSGQMLKSQPLSPTKLKVTRQSAKAAAPPPAPKVAEPPPRSPVNEEMCLRWNSHHSNMQTAFPNILSKEQYVDVTLAAEGKTLKCHRLILSSCSPYFEEVLSGISPFQHPVLFMRDIPFWILKSLCDFMYAGEVHIYQNKLEELLTVAEALKIKGLAGKSTPPENQEEQQQNKNETVNSNKEVKSKKQHYCNQQEKEKTQQQPPPLRKNPVFTNNYESTSQDYDNEDLLDPLDLLEPLYEEAAEEKKPSTIVKPKENKYQYQPVKRPFTRRLRKRKYSEQRDPSPPPVFSFRKGTRSRPNVKIPKYYHSDYSNPPKTTQNAQTDPLLDVEEIKTEPIDVEDNLIDYSDEENQYIENSIEQTNCETPIVITSAKSQQINEEQDDKFKKIKLTKPIITEVHTIKETNTTAGGLEVIKITVQQPGDVIESEEVGDSDKDKENEEGLDPLQALTITDVNGGEPSTDTITLQPEGTLESEVTEEETEISVPNEEITQTEDAVVESQNETTEGVIECQIESVEGAVVESSVDETVESTVEDVGVQSSVGETVESTVEGVDVESSVETVESAVEGVVVESSVEGRVEDTVEGAGVEATSVVEESKEEVAETNEDVPMEGVEEVGEKEEEEVKEKTGLDHLEEEAMNVVNVINMENLEKPPDIE